MRTDYNAFIIPLALLLIGIEYIIAKKQGKPGFQFDNTIASLSIGAAERLLNIFLHGSFYFLFKYIYENHALLHISTSWYNWIILLMLTDFVWYWYHRLGHEINLLWAFHIVHHQSDDYNLSTAARVTNLQSLVRTAFWSVLPFIGFTPEMVAVTLVIHGSYSFFTHTEIVDKLGWLEKILITPSHHRVHHASNPEYLDKNFGDIFIFWDKIFGTFQEENKKPVYGLTKPLASASFMWQHFHYLAELFYRIRQTTGFLNKLAILAGKPEVMQGDEREKMETLLLPYKKKSRPQTGKYRSYVIIQLSMVLIVSFCTVLFHQELDTKAKLIICMLVTLTLINCGALLEQRKWILIAEYLRLMTFLSGIGIYTTDPVYYIFAIALIIAGILSYSRVREEYFKILYCYSD